MQLLIVTGLSEAGKTKTLHTLEGLGYRCTDDLPVELLLQYAEHCMQPENRMGLAAVSVQLRSCEDVNRLCRFLRENTGAFDGKLLYLEASRERLLLRHKESRKLHPMHSDCKSMEEAIACEEELLKPIRELAQIRVDTTEVSPGKLRGILCAHLKLREENFFSVRVVSFGYKYGIPKDADLVLDARFLPNPYYVPELRHLTGRDEPVKEYILHQALTQDFLARLHEMLLFLLPHYRAEGKSELVIAVGCTGGRHRSVCVAEQLHAFLSQSGYRSAISHRDLFLRNELPLTL